MIRAYINRPNPHITIHADPNCHFVPKPNQRIVSLNHSSLSLELEKFAANEYPLRPLPVLNGLWLEVDLGDGFCEREVVEQIRKLLSEHYPVFRNVVVNEHCPGLGDNKVKSGFAITSSLDKSTRFQRNNSKTSKRATRDQDIRANVDDLIKNFATYLAEFERDSPFQREGQFEFHQKTITLRNTLGSAIAAINNEEFLVSLYQTLQTWGIGHRGSNLANYQEFKNALQSETNQIVNLEKLKIDDPQLDIPKLSNDLWQLIDSLEIVQNRAKLVACSKTLHHLLPDLVVPIDRKYTGYFFRSNNSDFQENQKKFLLLVIENFASIARATNPKQYVGQGWNTSQTKVIDNAIVGYVRKHTKQAFGIPASIH